MSDKAKAKEVPFENVMILPPKHGVCQIYAADHKPEQPHNRNSLYYQMKFHQRHRRFPTWADAMAHCEEHVKKIWTDSLAEHGVLVELPEETADGETE